MPFSILYGRTRPWLSLTASLALMLAMFAVSGAVKVGTLGNTEVPRFQTKLQRWGLPIPSTPAGMQLCQALIFCAGLWEVGALALIAAGMYRGDVQLINAGADLLILFTVLATAIFYVGPNWKPLAFMANMTALAALFMIQPAARDKLLEGNRPPPLLI